MQYRPELDGVRALAVLAVLLSHTLIPGTGGGWMGVDVFFVLSGYLITTLLLAERARTGAISLRRFYARRALRLYPALLVMLIIGTAFYPVFGGTLGNYGRMAASVALYLEDFVAGFTGVQSGFAHTWSLGVEEQFYLLWPIGLILMLRLEVRIGRWIAGLAIASFIVLVVLSFGPVSTGVPYEAYFLPWSRFGELLLGCGVAWALRSGRRIPVLEGPLVGYVLAGVAVALVVGGAFADRVPNFSWEAPAISVVAAALVWHLSATRTGLNAVLAWRPFVWVGRRSYGVYLYHAAFLAVLVAHFDLPRPLLAVVLLVVALSLAAVSYRFLEMPFLRMKKRLSTAPAEDPHTDSGRAATGIAGIATPDAS